MKRSGNIPRTQPMKTPMALPCRWRRKKKKNHVTPEFPDFLTCFKTLADCDFTFSLFIVNIKPHTCFYCNLSAACDSWNAVCFHFRDRTGNFIQTHTQHQWGWKTKGRVAWPESAPVPSPPSLSLTLQNKSTRTSPCASSVGSATCRPVWASDQEPASPVWRPEPLRSLQDYTHTHTDRQKINLVLIIISLSLLKRFRGCRNVPSQFLTRGRPSLTPGSPEQRLQTHRQEI